MKRILKLILIPLIIGGLTIPLLSCASESEEAELLENKIITVQRGNLTIDITAVGNLALSRTEDLAFDLFYQEGTVEEVLVEEGDTVEEGQVLATLDTEEWEDELSALEDQVTAAERALTVKERDLLQKKIDLINAEIDLEEAGDAWLETISVGRKVLRLEQRLEWYLENDPEEVEKINEIKQEIEWRWNEFFRVVSDSDEVTIKEMELELAQAQLEDTQISIEDAREALEDAQEELDEANSQSPEVRATFDGFVTMVNVEGGDEVLSGTVAVQIADPEKFEAQVLVSEMDILQIKLGGEVWVQVDAIQGLSLPAKVTHISPTATIQSGVVNYEVKVEIESPKVVMQDIDSEELPEHLQQAIEEGQITQEQAEEMIKQWEQGQEGQHGQELRMLPEDFQLREGLTVTVSILVDERIDVLLIPNAAITSQGGQTYVQVVSPDGVTEERVIKTGIGNWQFTEVTDGLSEGEEIIVPQGTTTTTSTTSQQRPSGIPIPGMRGHP